jgi:hypothetical protein
MRIPVKLPIMVRADNIGAMFMAENASAGVRTRHNDTRYHYIREHVEDSFIKILFVKTSDNDQTCSPRILTSIHMRDMC